MGDLNQLLTQEHRHPPVEYWFNMGGPKHSNNHAMKANFEKDAMRGLFAPELAVPFLLGLACHAIDDYVLNKEKHFKTLDFFIFFSEKRQIEEAKQLNYLGMADEILFNTSIFLDEKIPFRSKEYSADLRHMLQNIDRAVSESHFNVKFKIDIAKRELCELENELFLSYTNNVVGKEKGANKMWFVNYLSKQGLMKVKKISDEIIEGKQRFPYASAFLSKHIFEKADWSYVKNTTGKQGINSL